MSERKRPSCADLIDEGPPVHQEVGRSRPAPTPRGLERKLAEANEENFNLRADKRRLLDRLERAQKRNDELEAQASESLRAQRSERDLLAMLSRVVEAHLSRRGLREELAAAHVYLARHHDWTPRKRKEGRS